MIHNLVKVRGADFCDDQFPVISTIGRGPKGEQGEQGEQGESLKFADPIEWNSQNTYETLTVVLYQGDSYISKQAVPVDIDISDDEYWVHIGNFNAQIDQCKQLIEAAQDTLESIGYASSGYNVTDLLVDASLTEKIGNLPTGYVYQGMTIIDGYMYVIGYPATNQNSTLFKIDLSTLTVVNTYDFNIYVHGNSVTTYNNLIVVTDVTNGYYTFNTDLDLLNHYNPYSYSTPVFRNSSFCVFSDNIHAMSQIASHAGANVFYKDCDGIFTSYNLKRNELIGSYGYQDMCQCFNLVALLCSYGNNNKIFLFKYDGSIYMEIPLPALDIELEGIYFDNTSRIFHVTGADGSYYTFACAEFLSSSKTNITQINEQLYAKDDFWRAPANSQGVSYGDYVLCTNTDETRTVYLQRYIRKPNFANTGSGLFMWQLNTGAFVAGTQTAGGGIRANIPVFNALHGFFGLGLNYANAPTADRQGLNTVYVYDQTQKEPILRLASLNNMSDEDFVTTMKPFIDYMIATGILSTSSNVIGAIRPANNIQGDPNITFIKLLD